jgi:type IV pilus assembly protein PilY1
MNSRAPIAALLVVLGAAASPVTQAQTTYTENFTGGATTNTWYYYLGACLTAGTTPGTGAPGTTAGLIPSCSSIAASYYAQAQDSDPVLVGGQNGTLPDPVGSGALRFTNGYPYGNAEHGAIVSATPFNAGQGVQISFKTVTYRGDSGGAGGDGADGISFYLIDATQFPTNNPTGSTHWDGLGAWGGSLGYTCSNSNNPYDGLAGGYIGLGIDEFGNFLNGANLMPGYTGPNTASGDNTEFGYGYKPGRIGLRGAGNVSWPYLRDTYPAYYPPAILNTAALQQAAVRNTCLTGQVWNYAGSATNPVAVANPTPALQDYNPIPNAYVELPATIQIANEAAQTRPAATPIFYNLKITQNGLLSLSYSINGGAYNPILTNQSIVGTNGALPSSLLFGFAGSTGGDTNIHEILCFKAAPANQSASSAAVNEKQTAKVQTGAQIYFAYYNPSDWTGRVTANGLVDTGGVLTINALSNWDAQCVLTGVASGATCATTGVAGPTAAEGPTSRVMMTWNGLDTAASVGNAGISFEWPGGGSGTPLTGTEQSTIDAGDASATANRVNYLRGDRTNEINSLGAGLFRARDGVLGDIVDSSPTWVGPPQSPYGQGWIDRIDASDSMVENAGQSYVAFQAIQASRLNMIYVGANDGFLHGFETGSLNASGQIVSNSTTPNDGKEVMAYMPGAVLKTIHQYSAVPAIETIDATLDYANPLYAHNFFVDATPGTGDLYYQSAWHTWLIGGLGAGGAAIFALDITNPSSTTFTEANAASVVKGEWSSATITCVNLVTCGNSLGNTYSTPQIRRFHNGTWGAVFGNGYGSTNGDAGIYVMTVSQTTGAISFYYLSAGAAGANGIGAVATADLDGDHITDYIYAGDLKGNLWRFDLTSTNPANWAVTSNLGLPAPLFKTSTGQPITTAPILVSTPQVTGGLPMVLVAFGTGQRTQFTGTTATSYASGTQSLYGVWDWNMSAWNALSATAPYAALTVAQVRSATGIIALFPTLGPANLQVQTLTVNTAAGIVDTTNNTVTWAQCAAGCTGVFGWYANLPGTSGATSTSGAPVVEQIVSPPILDQSAFIVNSTIPANNSPLSCATNTDAGVTYVLSVTSGGTFVQPASTTGTGAPTYSTAFVNYHDTTMVGLITNETGALNVVNTVEGTSWLVGEGIAPPPPGGLPPQPTQINLPPNTTVSRLTWVELR